MTNDAYITHYPILAASVARTSGPILELGCGDGSTPMLHYMAGLTGRYLLSADIDQGWIDRYAAGYGCPRRHEFSLVRNWKDWSRLTETRWGVAFVDLSPGEDRHLVIAKLKGFADIIVAHDSERDYNVGADYKYERVKPLFKHVSEWRRFRPYTLILSDTIPFLIEECDQRWTPPKSS